MKKGWTTTKLVTVGAISALEFLTWAPIALIFSGSTNLFVYFITFVSESLFTVFTLLLIRTFGAVTLKTLLVNTLGLSLPRAVPLPVAVFYVLNGVLIDFLFIFIKKREKLTPILGGVQNILTALVVYITFKVIGVPGASKIPTMILTPSGLTIAFGFIFILGVGGGYLGYLAYRKILSTSVVKRIQNV